MDCKPTYMTQCLLLITQLLKTLEHKIANEAKKKIMLLFHDHYTQYSISFSTAVT